MELPEGYNTWYEVWMFSDTEGDRVCFDVGDVVVTMGEARLKCLVFDELVGVLPSSGSMISLLRGGAEEGGVDYNECMRLLLYLSGVGIDKIK